MRSERNPLNLKIIVYQTIMIFLGMGFLTGAYAQTNTVGNISGTVRDPQGAVVPGVQVTIQEVRTGVSRTVQTNNDGLYSALSLPVGIYTVSAAPQGYKKTVVNGPDGNGLELHVSENLVVNLTVEVGEVTETVTVTTGAVAVETRSGNVSSLISQKQVTELPLNGRNYAQLALMVPGVSPALGGGGANFAANGTGLNAGVDMAVNGNASNQNLWTVDGVNNMDVGSNRTLLVFPSIDAIQEFRVERNSFSAEFGQAQGAVINLVTKGGSNAFHGTLFEFLRNDALNANNFFINQSGDRKPVLRYNNFGGNFSGPIIKDRIFFFWSEEFRRERRGIALPTQKVPTAAERMGDFSGALTTVDGARASIRPRDPLTGALFPDNKIPQNRLSPAGLAILKIFPEPNLAALPGENNWVAAPTQPINNRQDLIRGDIVINSKMNLMVRYINEEWGHKAATGNFWGDSNFPNLSSDWDQPSQSFAIKLSTSISPTSVNEFQFSRAGNDIFITTSPATQALNDEIAAAFPTVFPREEGVGLPTVNGTGGYPTLQHQAPWTNHQDLFILKDDFSKVIGSHDLKLGAVFSHNIKNEINTGANGVAQFDMTSSRTGHPIADLLLRDLPLSGYTEIDHRENVLGRWRDLEFYVNDSWKVRPRLTLNLGLRWSKYSPPFSNNDRITNYLASQFNGSDPLSGLLQGETGVRVYNPGFQPRIGIAWDISGDGKTALRLGFGRFLSRTNVIEDLLRLAANPPWTVRVSTDTNDITPTSTLADDPTFRSMDAINSGLRGNEAGIGPNTLFNGVSLDFRPPESWQWNMTLSREIMRNTVLEASYIGNHGLHIWRRGINFNDVVPSARAAIAQATINGAPKGDLIDANRRFVGLGPVDMSESTGNSNYHAFQVWANRRFSDRLAFQASYTWSHAITDVALGAFNSTTTDPFNYNIDRGDADLDRRHMFIFNTVYSLPSFKNLGTVANAVIGEWQFNAIGSFLGGAPIDVIYSNGGNNVAGIAASPGGSGFRPDLVLGVPVYIRDSSDGIATLNPAAFALPGLGQFGNLGRGAIRQPRMETIDFAITKNWRARERYGIQFRTELFNVFNHTNFNQFSNNLNLQTLLTPPPGQPAFGQSSPSNNFGRAISALRSREIQFGLKLTF
jgi:Carboxypeptidase regulatory-like domain/TonB-dependent Receptor Plug Domain